MVISLVSARRMFSPQDYKLNQLFWKYEEVKMIFDLFLFPTPCPGCVISQDHAIKGSYFMGNRSPSKYVTILPSLVAIGTLVVGIKWVWFVTRSRKTMRSKSRVIRYVFSGWRGRLRTLSLKPTITVNFTWFESTQHIMLIRPILVTHFLGNEW